MPGVDFIHISVSFVVGVIAGTMNSVAAGGTLLTFPTLIWLGLNSISANATSTVAVWPGVVAGAFGYRRDVVTLPRRFFYLLIPSVTGGLIGAIMLRLTPSMRFDRVVPYLILFATFLFMIQDPIQRAVKSSHPEAHQSKAWFAGAVVFQFVVGVYGGYFGAGIGILMLASFGILGLTDIHQMNGFKNILAASINALAALYFILNNMVYWPDVGLIAAGTVTGGYVGVGVARKIGQKAVRKLVVLIGLGMGVSLIFRN
ncbi:MAG: sulfite exporter TauE/SafE family protein [Bryobacterales bacterium]|nr:sulfite exporter TauE/SafE family protein [Bryobacterales bacterium]